MTKKKYGNLQGQRGLTYEFRYDKINSRGD